MVKALHKAGIEVILDVVFNHTNEGNHQGPTLNFKGFDNNIYYHLVQNDRQYYMDYTGCGNTVNCNHPLAEKLIVECLEYWVREMHVDGFRFDEGSILSRGENGAPMALPAGHLAHRALGGPRRHQDHRRGVGRRRALPDRLLPRLSLGGVERQVPRRHPQVREGRARPDRRGRLAHRWLADLYQSSGHLPINSINFINCHDGFTLNDLVSYNEKHNEANGEGNNDGNNDNMSAGTAASRGRPTTRASRRSASGRSSNFATILMLSQGVPMFVAGDEVRRTQHGNNNAYCQDNPLTWFDWDADRARTRTCCASSSEMIAFRKRITRSCIRRGSSPATANRRGLTGHLRGTAASSNSPGWNDPNARVAGLHAGRLRGRPGHARDAEHGLGRTRLRVAGRARTAAGIWWSIPMHRPPGRHRRGRAGSRHRSEARRYIVNGRSMVVLISK